MAGADEVIRNLDAWFERTEAALHALGEHYGAKMEAEAKQEARWQDRTGDARRGMFGSVEQREAAMLVRLAHSEQHGVYLEMAMQGRFSIIEPTVKRNAPNLIRDAERVING